MNAWLSIGGPRCDDDKNQGLLPYLRGEPGALSFPGVFFLPIPVNVPHLPLSDGPPTPSPASRNL